jgi:hypothetical protein
MARGRNALSRSCKKVGDDVQSPRLSSSLRIIACQRDWKLAWRTDQSVGTIQHAQLTNEVNKHPRTVNIRQWRADEVARFSIWSILGSEAMLLVATGGRES